jgi:plastocyanin
VSEPEPPPKVVQKPVAAASLSGTVTGGAPGPGGTVVLLRRASGATPRPKPAKGKQIIQRGKTFIPHVLVVPVGTTVEFLNEDEISHNVFSLSRPNDFDLGLYKGGLAKTREFDSPGPVQLLCNIHSSMNGFVYVADTPWFGLADATGAFTIKGVPPGEYQLEAWHETASTPTRMAVRVEGDTRISLAVGGDKAPPPFVPDKYGKPRQVQLGY